ncbi:hypothetical protein F503_07614 [Ophiostoma piceae UAMH 11346]|uniref:F-box domain-containing protein n=1 Tax=Ophiostoma piceae (strain UAMH 11346) TaxID=1262450 RepID=S3CT39_OPHP1|nr:hypothetical protein F503_07614 [Ophiostoma piceae UAMH 11346]
MAKKAAKVVRPRLSRPVVSLAATPNPSSQNTPNQSTPSTLAYPSAYVSDDEDDEPAKFDVNTIPIHKLSLNGSSSASGSTAFRVPFKVITANGTASYGSMAEAEAAAEAALSGGGDRNAPVAPVMELVDGKLVEIGKEEEEPPKPFPFMRLPSELRVKVYAFHFEGADRVVDLCPENYRRVFRKLWLLRTCRTVYLEASYFYYSTFIFRVFPTSPGRFFKTRRPLLARLKKHQRSVMTTLELRLGPGFNKPPKCWVVTRKLALTECVSVRRLSVFVQIDPSVSWLDGFRKAGFYESFSRQLLEDILRDVPSIEVIEFDAYESVRKDCPIMMELLEAARTHNKRVAWGPRNGWTDAADNEQNTAAAAKEAHIAHGHDPNRPVAEAGSVSAYDAAMAMAVA